MLAILSPAKKLAAPEMSAALPVTEPAHLDTARILAARARALSRADLKRLMGISDKLADLNYERFQAFEPDHHRGNSSPALLTFQGDTYKGLAAESLERADLEWAQDHLRILSGLYGVLRPLDLIQPYRLEMGARLDSARGADLYDFWRDEITDALSADVARENPPVLIDLASREYSSAVDFDRLPADAIQPVFKEVRDGQSRVLGLYAKKARGAMARYMIDRRITEPAMLKAFDRDGYSFQPDLSDDHRWVFTRPQP